MLETTAERRRKRRTGRFFFCPGSGTIHPPLYLEFKKGERSIWAQCPHDKCDFYGFFRGEGWENAGVPREVAEQRNPGALFFT